ncbi:MAG: hypothetical protein ACRCXL_02005 [Dermatophilaceae bacterium]
MTRPPDTPRRPMFAPASAAGAVAPLGIGSVRLGRAAGHLQVTPQALG